MPYLQQRTVLTGITNLFRPRYMVSGLVLSRLRFRLTENKCNKNLNCIEKCKCVDNYAVSDAQNQCVIGLKEMPEYCSGLNRMLLQAESVGFDQTCYLWPNRYTF